MISIIGAGPSGCYAAYLLAKAGNKVRVFEEHNEIGKPIQCTGIVTSSIKDIIEIKKDVIINKIKTVRIYAPDNNYIELNLKNKNLILDRAKFDRYLAEKAEDSGAEIYLNYRLVKINNKFILIKDIKNKQFKKFYLDLNNNEKNKNVDCNAKDYNSYGKLSYLIGADGPLSIVSKYLNPKLKKQFWVGAQARIILENENIVEFYPYLGTFAWIVPENSYIVRIGVLSKRNPKPYFNKFLKLRNINKHRIIEKQGGLIPLYDKRIKIQKKNIFLIGDAATQVKATSAGGIIHGLLAAKCLYNCIVKNREYKKEVRKRINRDLWLHLKMRNTLDRFSLKDYNYLVSLFNKEKNKKILENYDRDYPSKFILKLAINEPRLLYFSKNLIT
jgi:geranylgeranyl reductase family protein